MILFLYYKGIIKREQNAIMLFIIWTLSFRVMFISCTFNLTVKIQLHQKLHKLSNNILHIFYTCTLLVSSKTNVCSQALCSLSCFVSVVQNGRLGSLSLKNSDGSDTEWLHTEKMSPVTAECGHLCRISFFFFLNQRFKFCTELSFISNMLFIYAVNTA